MRAFSFSNPQTVEEYLDDYNSVSNAPMKLVMFLDAIEHVSRITRVIRIPQVGVGVGGGHRGSMACEGPLL